MARFFIDRPVFAIVISLFLLLAGTLSLIQLPISEFPEIALPTVQVNASYIGESSDVVEESVTVPLDQTINGVTDMLYINAVSGDDGNSNITATFELERDPDLAAVEVQNRVAQAQSQLPQEVINQGVTVRKQSPDTLMYFSIHSPASTYDRLFINNDRGDLVIVKPGPNGYEEISRTFLLKPTSPPGNRREMVSVNWSHHF